MEGTRVNVLAVDTSTSYAATALGLSSGEVLVAPADPAERHGRGLLPAIRTLLLRTGLRPYDLDGFAVGLGPGSYTGLRVGITAIKTLAYATGRPVVGLESFDVVAANAPAEALEVAVLGDAQRGDIYVAEFTRPSPGATLARMGSTRIEPYRAYTQRLDARTLVIGSVFDGRAQFPDLPEPADPTWNRPCGERLIALAREALATGRRDEACLLEPLYLRRSAAEDLWDRKGRS
jgi:tRNA threonylcarbamoyladenosine biosynthesis protein TsaB